MPSTFSEVTVSPSFYNKVVAPLGLLLAALMAVGPILIYGKDAAGRLVGLVSYRALVRLVGEGRGGQRVPVREIMAPDPVTVGPAATSNRQPIRRQLCVYRSESAIYNSSHTVRPSERRR